MSPSRWVSGMQGFWCAPGLINSVLYSGILVVETWLSNTCPPILWVVSCKPCEAELSSACLSRSKGVSWVLVWPCLQVPLHTTATHRYGMLPPGTHQPEIQLLTYIHITHQLCHPCQMIREKTWVKPLAWCTEKMLTNATRPHLYHLKHMHLFSFKATEYLLWRPMLMVLSWILHPCLPTFLQSQRETIQVLKKWLLKCSGCQQHECHLETF